MNESINNLIRSVESARIIDLTHLLNENLPAAFGMPNFRLDPVVTRASGSPFEHNKITVSEHGGTHVDAPIHFIADSEYTIDKCSLKSFMGRAATLSFKGKNEVSADDIKVWEKENGEIIQGDIVLFSFGWEDKFYEPAFYQSYPGLSESAAKYLADKKINCVGTDALAVDVSTDTEFKAHYNILSNNIIIIENLKNLNLLPAFSFFIAVPLNIEGGTGSPARAMAFI